MRLDAAGKAPIRDIFALSIIYRAAEKFGTLFVRLITS